jgi:hypothetical protein
VLSPVAVEKGTKAVISVNFSSHGKRRFNDLRANFVREIPRKEFFNTHACLHQLSLSSSHDLPAIRGKLRQPMETRLPSLVKPDAVQQVGKAGVLAHGVKQRIYLQVL